MWDDIRLDRRPDGSIAPGVRAALVAKSNEEVDQAVACVLETEASAVLDARDPSKAAASGAALVALERLRELLRVREYSVQVDRVWTSLQHEERVRLIEHVDHLGAAPTEDSAKAIIALAVTRMAVTTLVGAARESVGHDVSVAEAMSGTPITMQLIAIRQAGDYHAAPGQALNLLGVKPKRRWFG
jgi:hypothetical protein